MNNKTKLKKLLLLGATSALTTMLGATGAWGANQGVTDGFIGAGTALDDTGTATIRITLNSALGSPNAAWSKTFVYHNEYSNANAVLTINAGGINSLLTSTDAAFVSTPSAVHGEVRMWKSTAGASQLAGTDLLNKDFSASAVNLSVVGPAGGCDDTLVKYIVQGDITFRPADANDTVFVGETATGNIIIHANNRANTLVDNTSTAIGVVDGNFSLVGPDARAVSVAGAADKTIVYAHSGTANALTMVEDFANGDATLTVVAAGGNFSDATAKAARDINFVLAGANNSTVRFEAGRNIIINAANRANALVDNTSTAMGVVDDGYSLVTTAAQTVQVTGGANNKSIVYNVGDANGQVTFARTGADTATITANGTGAGVAAANMVITSGATNTTLVAGTADTVFNVVAETVSLDNGSRANLRLNAASTIQNIVEKYAAGDVTITSTNGKKAGIVLAADSVAFTADHGDLDVSVSAQGDYSGRMIKAATGKTITVNGFDNAAVTTMKVDTDADLILKGTTVQALTKLQIAQLSNIKTVKIGDVTITKTNDAGTQQANKFHRTAAVNTGTESLEVTYAGNSTEKFAAAVNKDITLKLNTVTSATVGEFTTSGTGSTVLASAGTYKGLTTATKVKTTGAIAVTLEDAAITGEYVVADETLTIAGTSQITKVNLGDAKKATIASSATFTGGFEGAANGAVYKGSVDFAGTKATLANFKLDNFTFTGASGVAQEVELNHADANGKLTLGASKAKLKIAADITSTKFSVVNAAGVGDLTIDLNAGKKLNFALGADATKLAKVTLSGAGSVEENIYAGSLGVDGTTDVTFVAAKDRVVSFAGDVGVAATPAVKLTFNSTDAKYGVSFGTGTGVVYATALSFTGVKDTVHAMKVAGVKGTASDIAENVKVQFGVAGKAFMLDQAVTGKGTAEFLGTTTVKSKVNDANANLVFADKVTFEGGNITQAKTADFKKGFELKADATVNNISALVGGLDVSTHTLTTDSGAKIASSSSVQNPSKIGVGGQVKMATTIASGDEIAKLYVEAPANLATDVKQVFWSGFTSDVSADNLKALNEQVKQSGNFDSVRISFDKSVGLQFIGTSVQAYQENIAKDADLTTKDSGDFSILTTPEGEVVIDKAQKDVLAGFEDVALKMKNSTDKTSPIALVFADYNSKNFTKEDRATLRAKLVERAVPAADVASVSGVSDITSAIGASVSTSGAVSLASNNIDTRLASLGLASGSEGSSGVGFWAQGMMSTGTQDKDGAQEAFGITTKAITGGFDFSPADGHAMGVAFTYANADLDLTDGTKEKTSFVPKVFNMYTSNSLGSDVFFRGRFDLAYTDATNTGKGVFSAKDKELKSTYQTRYLGASGLVGVNVAVAENTFIAPMGGMNYKHIEGYVYKQQLNETASLKKEFASKGAASVTGGFSLYYVSSGEGYSIVPEATVMGVYDLDTQGQKMTVNDSDLVYTVEGEKAASALSVNGSVGATVKYDTIEVGVKAHGAWRSKYLGYGGSLKLRVNL